MCSPKGGAPCGEERTGERRGVHAARAGGDGGGAQRARDQRGEASLFNWIVSDFGLNDAIESGLVKKPHIVVRDDAVPNARSYRSKLYHVYPEVREEAAPLEAASPDEEGDSEEAAES